MEKVTNIREHLMSRDMDCSKQAGLFICDTEQVATFLLYNLSRQIVGYQQYRPNGGKGDRSVHPKLMKYYNYISKPCASKDAQIAVWGVQTVNFKTNYVFLTEGIFDAVKLHNLGLEAVAVLCNNPKHIKSWIRGLNKFTISICDNDAAGRKLASLADLALFPEEDKDLGDMTESEVIQLLNSNEDTKLILNKS